MAGPPQPSLVHTAKAAWFLRARHYATLPPIIRHPGYAFEDLREHALDCTLAIDGDAEYRVRSFGVVGR